MAWKFFFVNCSIFIKSLHINSRTVDEVLEKKYVLALVHLPRFSASRIRK